MVKYWHCRSIELQQKPTLRSRFPRVISPFPCIFPCVSCWHSHLSSPQIPTYPYIFPWKLHRTSPGHGAPPWPPQVLHRPADLVSGTAEVRAVFPDAQLLRGRLCSVVTGGGAVGRRDGARHGMPWIRGDGLVPALPWGAHVGTIDEPLLMVMVIRWFIDSVVEYVCNYSSWTTNWCWTKLLLTNINCYEPWSGNQWLSTAVSFCKV